MKQAYKAATLRNRVTGDREPVELAGLLGFEEGDKKNPGCDAQLELRADLQRAVECFSPIERRVLMRVLVGGQSIEQATMRVKSKSQNQWRRWFVEVALPEMRKLMKDYLEQGRVVFN